MDGRRLRPVHFNFIKIDLLIVLLRILTVSVRNE